MCIRDSSTAGGIKVVRVGILCKLGCREVRRTFQPRKVQVVRLSLIHI